MDSSISVSLLCPIGCRFIRRDRFDDPRKRGFSGLWTAGKDICANITKLKLIYKAKIEIIEAQEHEFLIPKKSEDLS
jgi:hypothetical protein